MYLNQRDKAKVAFCQRGVTHPDRRADVGDDNSDQYPAPTAVTPQRTHHVASYIDVWPQNPYVAGDMVSTRLQGRLQLTW